MQCCYSRVGRSLDGDDGLSLILAADGCLLGVQMFNVRFRSMRIAEYVSLLT
jgi:hypothetical protein